MHNDSTDQFEGGKYLEAASSLSVARFEGTGLLQHEVVSVQPEKTALF